MGLFGKSTYEKIVDNVAKLTVQYYKYNDQLRLRQGQTSQLDKAFVLLETAAMVQRVTLDGLDSSPEERSIAEDKLKEHFSQHLDRGAKIGLKDVCGIVHICCFGLQETYTMTLNRYIQALYRRDIIRFDIEGEEFDELSPDSLFG